MRDKVISIVKSQGPLLPALVAKAIGSNILMASAYLSELVANRIIKISTIKVGGSPLYYAPGQEAGLQNFSDNLNEKERRTYELLKERKILADATSEPLVRVALRELKDFAVPLKVNNNGRVEIFWKWYLTPNEEIEGPIRKILDSGELAVKQQKTETVQAEQEVKQAKPEVRQESQVVERSQEISKKEYQVVEKAAIKEEIKTEIPEKEDIAKDKPKEVVKTGAKREKRSLKKDEFLEVLEKFFEKNKIEIVESTVLRKNSEIDFIIEMASPVGKLRYYCKAKNKKRVSDSDLSNAFVRGQMKKLPVLFLSNGELSKKAIELIDSELKGLNFKKI